MAMSRKTKLKKVLEFFRRLVNDEGRKEGEHEQRLRRGTIKTVHGSGIYRSGTLVSHRNDSSSCYDPLRWTRNEGETIFREW